MLPVCSKGQVLQNGGSSFASDVYSFGIVVWEVLTREVPWAGVSHDSDLYRRVVIVGDRPVIPDTAPDNSAETAKSCWGRIPANRPTFRDVLGGMRANGWQDD
ncbi:unnamed protein product [Ascophyllum nodosum]